MTHSTPTMMRIVAAKTAAKKPSTLSKGQKLFAKLIKKIDAQRKLLETWQHTIPLYRQHAARDYEPLLQTFNQHKAEMVHLFDQVYTDKIFSKTEKNKLRDIICTMASELSAEVDNADIKLIYNKYSGSDFDSEAEEVNEVMKSMVSAMLGVDLDDDVDIHSPEDMMRHIGEKLQHKQMQQEERQEAQRAKQKKSAKAIAKEARQQAEEQNISQSIREVFRKLASALHPDKEQDPEERARKTALMQRVNVAYGKKDLLQLLELQLEVEQIDEAMIHSISEERLAHYNTILKEQSAELQSEINFVEYSFGASFNLPPYVALTPTSAMSMLQDDVDEVQRDIRAIKNELQIFQDTKKIKLFLKAYRIAKQPVFQEDELFRGMDFGAMLREGGRRR